jgi:hypothetical protein
MQVSRSNKRPIISAREAPRRARRARQLARRSTWSRDEVRGLLIEAGEFEAAVVDRMCPTLDRTDPVERACREMTMAVARLAIDAGWIGSPGVPPKPLQALCHAADLRELPALAQASRPELADADGVLRWRLRSTRPFSIDSCRTWLLLRECGPRTDGYEHDDDQRRTPDWESTSWWDPARSAVRRNTSPDIPARIAVDASRRAAPRRFISRE